MRWVYEIEASLKSPQVIIVGYLLFAMATATESACEERIADASASFFINFRGPVYLLCVRVFNHIFINHLVFFRQFVGFQMVVYEGDSVLIYFQGVLHRTIVSAFILDGTC